MKEKTEAAPGKENSTKGFNLPRVYMTDVSNLYPMFLKDPTNSSLGPSDTYVADKANIDLSHRGLMVYNLNTTAPFKEGVYVWNGISWIYFSNDNNGISPWYSVETQASAIRNTQDVYLKGAVTIGKEASESSDLEGALLQLAEDVPAGRSQRVSHNAYRGLALPRVKLTNKNELYPMFLTNKELAYEPTANPEMGGYEVPATKVELKASHAGLIVYNVSEDNDKELCPGLNQWDGEQWNCFQIKMGNAAFDPVSCSDITVSGVYVVGVATTYANYLNIKLNVKKVGAFTIIATSGNGYVFYLSGVALSVGVMTVNVPCQGTPVNARTDKLTISGMNLVPGCEPEVEVASPISDYSLNCSSIVVNGDYRKGIALTASNTITLRLTVQIAGSYHISTPLTNGISFLGKGNLAVGTQTITLKGTGIPTVNTDFPVTINANNRWGNTSCSTTVPVILPRLTYAIIGTDVWSWAAQPRLNALASSSSFGPHGIARTEGLTQLWSEGNVDLAADGLNDLPEKPDIVLYFAYGATPNDKITAALTNYINKGGCVIYGSADHTESQVNILLNGVFGISTAESQEAGAAGADNPYKIAYLPDDPIINGPFGNLSSRYWGEDNDSNGSVIVTALPANSVQICSAGAQPGKIAVNPDYSIVWYNDSKNFVYFGDSTGASDTNSAQDAYPSYYTPEGTPRSKYYGTTWGANAIQFVYNSALELNAVAWALRKAAVSGINPH